MIMLMMMIVAAAALLTVLVMVVLVIMLVMMLVIMQIHVLQGLHPLLHHLQDFLSLQLRDRGGDEAGVPVDSADQLHRLVHLLPGSLVHPAEDDGVGVLQLILKELSEVAQVHLTLGHIRHGGEAVKL